MAIATKKRTMPMHMPTSELHMRWQKDS